MKKFVYRLNSQVNRIQSFQFVELKFIRAERDGLNLIRIDLERRLERKELELHEKEEELFLQLEKVIRLEEDCEKLRAQKEKFEQWKDKLEEEKNEAYRQLQLQASASETVRRRMEAARQDVVRQVTVIAAERESLEKENEMLKDKLKEERRGVSHYIVDLSEQKKQISQDVIGLEKEVTDLKFVARQTASLNNQFKKGMKHLATCKKRKCSVCNYTRATFGDYEDGQQSGPSRERGSGAATPLSTTPSMSSDCLIHSSPARASRSPRRSSPPPSFFPGPPAHCSCRSKHRAALTPCSCPSRPSSFCPRPSLTPDISFIDEASNNGEGESGGEDGAQDEDEEEVGDASLGSCYVEDDLSSSHDAADELTTTISAHYDEYEDEEGLEGARGGGVVRAQSCPCGGPSSKGEEGGASMMTCSGSPTLLPPSCSVPNDASLASTSTSTSEQQPHASSTRAFSSDSGFSSEMCEPVFCQRGGGQRRSTGARRRRSGDGNLTDGGEEDDQVGCRDPGGFRRSKWTASFRKLIHRVSKRFQGHH
ncbi:hypothetical protein J437_LFUL012430 [Ladona fulva]|uniref:Uncharacterized protein n=1 Tax=Ladona fulva TaxID=123851 RepID=A0A8K0P2B5_LADFU|nr:hypothetical protein J437_LFUL012430 [Ladona fulva]